MLSTHRWIMGLLSSSSLAPLYYTKMTMTMTGSILRCISLNGRIWSCPETQEEQVGTMTDDMGVIQHDFVGSVRWKINRLSVIYGVYYFIRGLHLIWLPFNEEQAHRPCSLLWDDDSARSGVVIAMCVWCGVVNKGRGGDVSCIAHWMMLMLMLICCLMLSHVSHIRSS